MADNPTTRNRLRKQQTNGNFNLWGDLLNTDVIEMIDESLDGMATIAVNANVTLTSINYATDQARMRMLRFTGAGGFDVTLPAVTKNYIIHNQCPLAVNVWTGAGLKVACAANSCTKIMSDGVDCYAVTIGSIADRYDPSARLIINGDFAIDQPNGGAEIAFAGSAVYAFDGCQLSGSGAGRFKVKSQISSVLYGSTCLARTSALFTVTTAAASPGSGDFYMAVFKVEGTRWRRLKYGSASPSAAVLRFRAQSSVAVTLSGAIRNSATDRNYPWSVALSANTPTDVQIQVPGDASGTWLTDTGIGCYLTIALGLGSLSGGTAGAWAAGSYPGIAGAGLMATLGATLEITGLDIIPGTVVPPVYIPPDPALELTRCQREYATSAGVGENPYAAMGGAFDGRSNGNSDVAWGQAIFPVTMRGIPAVALFDDVGTSGGIYNASTNGRASGFAANSITSRGFFSVSKSGALLTANHVISAGWRADKRL